MDISKAQTEELVSELIKRNISVMLNMYVDTTTPETMIQAVFKPSFVGGNTLHYEGDDRTMEKAREFLLNQGRKFTGGIGYVQS